jgi:hypothetical protein
MDPNLENSLVFDPNNPLAVEQARLLQGIISAKQVLDDALKTYYSRNKDKADPVSLLWITVPAMETTIKMLKGLLPED